LDVKLGLLAQAASQNPNEAQTQFDVADFLLARQNAYEAIPYLEIVARNAAADTTLRIRAWIALARAHLWVGEPEKGRHEAENLITVLGGKTGDARAAGKLVLGIQDAAAKRTALAREELGEATAAAPDSIYGRQAVEELAKLPGATK
jgi:tetratricopeptide (TPR) repeat protein